MDYRELQISFPEIFNNKEALLQIITNEEIINNWVTNKREKLLRDGLPINWGNIGIVYEDPYIVILRDLVKLPDGNLSSYFRILHSADLQGGQAVVVLPIIKNKILILRIFRHSTRKWHWEFPRGFGEPNTSPEDNARKELREEISAEIDRIENLGIYHSNLGLLGASVQLFFARLKSIGKVNKSEGIDSYNLVDLKTIEEMILKSDITDGYTIATYTRAKLMGFI